jgi:hypothetical protein
MRVQRSSLRRERTPNVQPTQIEHRERPRLGVGTGTQAGFVDCYPVKFGDPRIGVAAGGAPGFGRAFFGVGGAFFEVSAVVVGGVVVGVVVVGAVVVVDGGGLPAVVCARATLEICGATQTAALAARPALTVAFANSRRVNPPAWPSSLSPRVDTLSTLASRAVCVKHANLA